MFNYPETSPGILGGYWDGNVFRFPRAQLPIVPPPVQQQPLPAATVYEQPAQRPVSERGGNGGGFDDGGYRSPNAAQMGFGTGAMSAAGIGAKLGGGLGLLTGLPIGGLIGAGIGTGIDRNRWGGQYNAPNADLNSFSHFANAVSGGLLGNDFRSQAIREGVERSLANMGSTNPADQVMGYGMQGQPPEMGTVNMAEVDRMVAERELQAALAQEAAERELQSLVDRQRAGGDRGGLREGGLGGKQGGFSGGAAAAAGW